MPLLPPAALANWFRDSREQWRLDLAGDYSTSSRFNAMRTPFTSTWPLSMSS